MQKKVDLGKWTITGGHVDSGETPLNAIQRETYEEIGVRIPLQDFILLNISKEEKCVPNINILNKNKDDKYTFIKWKDIGKRIEKLKEMRNALEL